MSGATAIGTLSAILTTFSWIPQALKTIRTRRADDFSWSYLAMFATGVSGWVVYGVLRNDPIIIGANAVAAGLLLPIILIKSRYRNQKPETRNQSRKLTRPRFQLRDRRTLVKG